MGLLTFQSRSDGAYSLQHRELATRVAYQISPAVENARLHRQERLLAEEHARRVSVEAERDEFQRMNEAKSKLLSLISHELKTPLTGISAFSELLSENPSGHLTARQLQQIRLIRRSAGQLGLLINDLLEPVSPGRRPIQTRGPGLRPERDAPGNRGGPRAAPPQRRAMAATRRRLRRYHDQGRLRPVVAVSRTC
jgi:hypothetical protein